MTLLTLYHTGRVMRATGDPWKLGSPGCPCCEPCLIQSNRLNSDADLDNNFSLETDPDNFEYHGDPFDAIQVSAAGQTATANTAHPQSPYPPRVQIEFYGDAIGSQARLILGGRIVVQVTIGDEDSELDILKLSDESELCDTLTLEDIGRNEWVRLTACFDPDTEIVKAVVKTVATGPTYTQSTWYTDTALTAYAAFGTGPASVDNVYFRNFYFWRLWYCGDSPYTDDCHILGDDWDYYYELPTRTYCYWCEMSCSFLCEDGTVPTTISAYFVDVDVPVVPPADWDLIYAWCTASHTYEQGYRWVYNGSTAEVEKSYNPCYYGRIDDDTYGWAIVGGASITPYLPYFAFTAASPGDSQVQFFGSYWTIVGELTNPTAGPTSIAPSPFDCLELLDGLEMICTQGSEWWVSTVNITASGAHTLTVAEDWSCLTAGRGLRVLYGWPPTLETYTVESISGTGPTVITVVEDVGGDRTGATVTKYATLIIEVP